MQRKQYIKGIMHDTLIDKYLFKHKNVLQIAKAIMIIQQQKHVDYNLPKLEPRLWHFPSKARINWLWRWTGIKRMAFTDYMHDCAYIRLAVLQRKSCQKIQETHLHEYTWISSKQLPCFMIKIFSSHLQVRCQKPTYTAYKPNRFIILLGKRAISQL